MKRTLLPSLLILSAFPLSAQNSRVPPGFATANLPAVYNTVVIDGCTNSSNPTYACDFTGLTQAIRDANGHSGVAGVVYIPPTTNCASGCAGLPQYLQLSENTLSVPSYTYIVGAGMASTFVDYGGSACAIDFPAGTVGSALIGFTVEQDAGQASSGLCIEGTASGITSDNSFYDFELLNDLATFGYVTNQKGIVLTPTPSGSAGQGFITANNFDNVRIRGISQPVISNGAFQNRFKFDIEGLGANQTAISGCLADNHIDAVIADTGVRATNAVAFAPTCNNNHVDLAVNFLSPSSRILMDTSGNNIISVLDRQAVGLGTVGADSDVVYCTPMQPKCTHYLRALQFSPTSFDDLGTPQDGTLRYCSDCVMTNPCAPGGTGAFAKRLNGLWLCQ